MSPAPRKALTNNYRVSRLSLGWAIDERFYHLILILYETQRLLLALFWPLTCFGFKLCQRVAHTGFPGDWGLTLPQPTREVGWKHTPGPHLSTERLGRALRPSRTAIFFFFMFVFGQANEVPNHLSVSQPVGQRTLL